MKVSLVLLALFFSTTAYPTSEKIPADKTSDPAHINVILVIADGFSLQSLTAARIHTFGLQDKSQRFRFEKFSEFGYVSTHSANSVVTDSAAGAAAMSCGEKHANNTFCYGDTAKQDLLFDIAHKHGMLTGIVATKSLTNATPAAFYARTPFRVCYNSIVTELFEKQRVDVAFGGGRKYFTGTSRDDRPECGEKPTSIETPSSAGYRYITTREEMLNLETEDVSKIIGAFAKGHLTSEIKRKRRSITNQPHLSEMTDVALYLLEENEKGFLLMIESSLIDSCGHKKDIECFYSEIVELDRTIGVIKSWINEKRGTERKENTLVILTADHDTGGLAIIGPIEVGAPRPENTLPHPGDELIVSWAEHGPGDGHTAVDVPIWSEGPGSEHLRGAIDNIDIYKVIRDQILRTRR